MSFDEEYWTGRWQNADTAWDLGYASTPLKTYIEQLNNKNIRILIPGAGNAYEGVLLHQLGFKNTDILDISPDPLKKLAAEHPEIPAKNLVLHDFFTLQGEYDLILEQTFFCAIDVSLRRKYFEKIHSLLAPGGKLVGVLFNTTFDKPYPPFGGNPTEYEKQFAGLFTPHTWQECYNSIKPRQGREWFINLVKI